MPPIQPWFQGRPGVQRDRDEAPVEVDSIDRDRWFGADQYDAEPGLVDAVNTALLLGQPLLLTGEPGTGKTQLAEKLALELGLPLLKFETKSSSVAQDLYYSFDHVARFQAAQVSQDAEDLSPLRFVDFGALGRAIVRSLPADPPTGAADDEKVLCARELFSGGTLPKWYQRQGRSVVLIDEIDKAPSDFPNDALNEIERHFFRLREWDSNREIAATAAHRPIVVITSNSEKQLPDAFLRRCIFHHLPDITSERLQAITLRRLAALDLRPGPLLDGALTIFFELRSAALDLRKRPSTAEFLSFVTALRHDPGNASDRPLARQAVLRVLSTLVKAPEDQKAAQAHLLAKPLGPIAGVSAR